MHHQIIFSLEQKIPVPQNQEHKEDEGGKDAKKCVSPKGGSRAIEGDRGLLHDRIMG